MNLPLSFPPSPPAARRAAFTLIELLVVIAIAGILGALIFSAVGKATEKANGVKCLSNVRQIISLLPAYAQDNNGLWPRRREPGPNGESDNNYDPFSAGLFPYLEGGPRCLNWGDNPYALGLKNNHSIFRCPGAKKSNFPTSQQGDYFRYGYAYNFNLPTTDEANPNNVNANVAPMKIAALSKTMVIVDSHQNVVGTGGNIWGSIGACQTAGAFRHGGHCTTGFGDGHAAPVDFRNIYDIFHPDDGKDGTAFWRGR